MTYRPDQTTKDFTDQGILGFKPLILLRLEREGPPRQQMHMCQTDFLGGTVDGKRK